LLHDSHLPIGLRVGGPVEGCMRHMSPSKSEDARGGRRTGCGGTERTRRIGSVSASPFTTYAMRRQQPGYFSARSHRRCLRPACAQRSAHDDQVL
jgi:hypothetical protein